jgi:hypothetical protein
MLSRMLWIRRGVIALLALVVVGLGLAIWHLNGIVADVLESQGTAALGVDTTIDFISIGFLPPSLRFGGFEIENPEGFKDDNFLELGKGALDVEFRSLFGPTVRARSLRLDDIEVSLERGARRGNYGVILDNVKAGSGQAQPAKPAADAGPGKTFRIDEIVLRNVRANLVMNLPGHAQAFAVTLPEVRMEGVGSGSSGPAVAGEVFRRITVGVLEALADQGALPGDIASDLTGALGGVPRVAVNVTGDVLRTGGGVAEDIGRGGAGRVKDAAKGTGRAAGDAADTAVGGLKKPIPGD